jgi:hypothetical protein
MREVEIGTLLYALATALGVVLAKLFDWMTKREGSAARQELALRRDLFRRVESLGRVVDQMGEDIARWRNRYFDLQRLAAEREQKMRETNAKLEAEYAILMDRHNETIEELKRVRDALQRALKQSEDGVKNGRVDGGSQDENR